jgi:hypothetical protein
MLFFFKAHSGTISSINSLLNKIFWGGEVRKLGKPLGLVGTLYVCVRRMEVWGLGG